jgi:hypothetical protein
MKNAATLLGERGGLVFKEVEKQWVNHHTLFKNFAKRKTKQNKRSF